MGNEKTSGTGLAPNIAGLLCYLLMPFTCGFPAAGIVFLVIEKGHLDVRFHAWQSILLGGAFWMAWFICNGFGALVPLFGLVFRLLFGLIFLASLTAWVICMLKAYQGERWRIPYLGDVAAKQAGA
ncbi:MAG: hypothetical protein HYV03_03805 [Deltaproteobacteria bacterium]|nr:hypothetical protein [Deltaproteobacteria bacterium]